MNLRTTSPKRQAGSDERPQMLLDETERCLTLLAEGAAMNMPEIHDELYKDFRSNINKLALQLRDSLPEEYKLDLIRSILREFEAHRNKVEDILRERLTGWRGLTASLFTDLLKSRGLNPNSESALPLAKRIGSLLTVEEIQAYRLLVGDFLRLGGRDAARRKDAGARAADCSTANDNASGLRGGGAALEHVKTIIDKGAGFVVLFRLGCLDMIGKRFGWDAVQDSVMAVSAFLTHSLRSDDGIYHWSDSSLLAILNSPATEQMLAAAMQRIVDNNREITIQIANRPVMLRVPLEFEITPVNRLRTPEDLYRL